MSTFIEIMRNSSLVFTGLTIAAIAFALLGKFLTDISHDPDADDHH